VKQVLGVLFLVLAVALVAPAGELTFVGAACSAQWRTDLYLEGDASAYPGPQTVVLRYTPFGSVDAVTAEVSIEGGAADWAVWAPNVVCEHLPGVEDSTGVLTVTLPWDASGWARTWSPPGFGQLLEPAEGLSYSAQYRVPQYDVERFRANLLLYNPPGGSYSVLVVGATWVFLTPGEALAVLGVAPGAGVELVSGGVAMATCSVVDNATNDGTTVPLLVRPGG